MTIESPYRRGADDGMKFGIYLTAMFAGALFGGSGGIMSVLTLLMMAAAPVVLWRLILSYHRSLGSESKFGDLWLDGTLTVIFGMLLATAFLIIYMKWINPGFVTDNLRAIIEMNDAHPEMGLSTYATVASNLIENNLVPSATQMAANVMVMSVMFGIIVAAVISLAVTLVSRAGSARSNKN